MRPIEHPPPTAQCGADKWEYDRVHFYHQRVQPIQPFLHYQCRIEDIKSPYNPFRQLPLLQSPISNRNVSTLGPATLPLNPVNREIFRT
jgi:hypothetical protein